MDFTPNLSPKEIIRLGSFGGIYFYDEEGRIDINYKEFPSDWFEGLEESFYLSKKYNRKINFFKIKFNFLSLIFSLILTCENIRTVSSEILSFPMISILFTILEIAFDEITAENVIRNQLMLDEGDPFSEILLNKSVNNIKSLNFFKNVKTEVLEGKEINSKIINIELRTTNAN